MEMGTYGRLNDAFIGTDVLSLLVHTLGHGVEKIPRASRLVGEGVKDAVVWEILDLCVLGQRLLRRHILGEIRRQPLAAHLSVDPE